MNSEATHISLNVDRLRVVIYLVLVPVVIFGLATLLYFQRRSENSRATRLAKADAAQIAEFRGALAEVCHTNTVMSNVLDQTILFIQSTPQGKTPAGMNALSGFMFYAQELAQQSACQNLTRP